METVPTWKTPHDFTLLPIADEALPDALARWQEWPLGQADGADLPAGVDLPPKPVAVFTYGPLVHDLIRARDLTPKRVARNLHFSVGLEWFASLVDELRRRSGLYEPRDPTRQPGRDGSRHGSRPAPWWQWEGGAADEQFDDAVTELTRVLRRTYQLRPSYGAAPVANVIPLNVITNFVDENKRRYSEWVDAVLKPLAQPLLTAAEDGTRPEPNADDLDRVRALLHGADIRLDTKPLVYSSGEPAGNGLAVSNLYQLVSLELAELYEHRPIVKLCRDCHRLFVPRRASENYCRRNVWRWSTTERVRGCTAEAKINKRARTQEEYRRGYKTRHQRVLDRKARYGDDDPRTLEAKADLEEWREHGQPRPGRPRTSDGALIRTRR